MGVGGGCLVRLRLAMVDENVGSCLRRVDEVQGTM